MPQTSKAGDTVSALLYDPEIDEIRLLRGDTDTLWDQFVTVIRGGEHPILALRRALADLGVPLPENQYYYLQSVVHDTDPELTQYLVLHHKGKHELKLKAHVRAQWFSKNDETVRPLLTQSATAALQQFVSRFGSEFDRRNMVHMMHLAARP